MMFVTPLPTDVVRLHLMAIASFAEAGSSCAAIGDKAGIVEAIKKVVVHLQTASSATLELLDDESGREAA